MITDSVPFHGPAAREYDSPHLTLLVLVRFESAGIRWYTSSEWPDEADGAFTSRREIGPTVKAIIRAMQLVLCRKALIKARVISYPDSSLDELGLQ